ncbi:vitellogenin-1-like precursor [Bactrocera dorsalis]|uniref:Vitellogenin 1 n=1 Tax=Bactrocera dorsalis TaxID=27457 RepID=Q8T7E3_BACDO|nr:vitellogenin-1-like precursor [Bactrocera dorsalis]AAM00372.1 vitellogenin 1 precursor [Bactrocera dorsalis]ABW96009.1 yolk protein 1 [Bactrocera dorsalis]
MNPLKIFCFMAFVLAIANASPKHGKNKDNMNSLKPVDWLSASELESMPSVEDITLQQLENMSVEDAQRKIEKLYHLSQINHALEPSFVPSPSNVPVILMKPNGQPERTNLNELVQTAKQQPNFGDEEVTIFITGLPQSSPSVAKANKKLIQAYMQRYNGQRQPISNNQDYDYGNNKDNQGATSSEEDYSESWKNPKPTKGNLVVISLGSTLTNMKRLALIDVEQTGNMIGKALVELTNECGVPQEIIHIVGQGVGAQVAGAAGRQYKRLTGHQLRRITALDPAKLFAKDKDMLTGLARGDADFVDAIHTSTCGMGTRQRVGDVDFYVNGPASAAPGATNVIEATMRATRYFAESVRPGNERNFPAVAANSMDQYENNDGAGKRAYMGIATDFDLEGDYILKVNSKSPFGKSAPAQKQSTYHGQHQAWKSGKNQNNN